MGKNKQKSPKQEFNPMSGKTPRHKVDVINYQTQHPSWQIARIDMDGRWGWNNIEESELKTEVLSKIKNFESNTWAEILGDNNHEVSIGKINKDAQKRLDELKLYDIESLVSLRLSNKKRIWGIRVAAVLKILWWDPFHEVCPSPLKHT
ncbi:MAG TPA: hypothetical protein VMV77_15245 [Bacteroidales bacterium]|nr:hypothetical protein [Bacteroidales bacterium]